MHGNPIIQSSRLRLSEFAMADAADVYNCITPAITKYMFWEPPSPFEAYKARREQTLQSTDRNDHSFVIRRLDTMECLGIASLDGIDADPRNSASGSRRLRMAIDTGPRSSEPLPTGRPGR